MGLRLGMVVRGSDCDYFLLGLSGFSMGGPGYYLQGCNGRTSSDGITYSDLLSFAIFFLFSRFLMLEVKRLILPINSSILSLKSSCLAVAIVSISSKLIISFLITK